MRLILAHVLRVKVRIELLGLGDDLLVFNQHDVPEH